MVSVPPVSTPRPALPRRSGAARSDFSVADLPAAASAAVLPGLAAAALQSGLLQLQEAAAESRTHRRVRSLLTALGGLQLGLLAGDGSDAAALNQLRKEIEDLPRPADPEIGRLLDAVALRVAVELARHDPP